MKSSAFVLRAVLALSTLIWTGCGKGGGGLDTSAPGGDILCPGCTECTEAGLGGGVGAGGGGSGGGGGGGGGAASAGGGGFQGVQCGGSPAGPGASGGALFAGGAIAGCPSALGGGLGLADNGIGFGDGAGFTGSSRETAPAPGGDGEEGGSFPQGGAFYDADGNPIDPEDLNPFDPLGEFGAGFDLPCCHVDCPGGPSQECEYVCGNGVVEAPELCDGNCPQSCDDGDECTLNYEFGDPYRCYAACWNVPKGCANGDGCCNDFGFLTGFCHNLNDNDCPPPPGDVGSPCASPEHCTDVDVDDPAANEEGIVCLPARPDDSASSYRSYFAGGYCSRNDCGRFGCPEGNTCLRGGLTVLADVGLEGLGGTCAHTCGTASDCRSEGYDCYDVDGDDVKECWLSGTGTRSFGAACNGIWECSGGQSARCITVFDLSGQSMSLSGQQICSQLCDANDDTVPACPDQYRCYLSSCQPAPAPVNLGGPCDGDRACGGPGINANRCKTALAGFKDGMCTSEYVEGNCPAGSIYAEVLGSNELSRPSFSGCAPTCAGDSDCRGEGYRCLMPDKGESKVCAAVWEGPGEFGDACEGNWDCDHPDGFSCLRGACTKRCSASQPSACPSGYTCGLNVCVPTCSSSADCPDNRFCGPNFTGGDEKICY